MTDQPAKRPKGRPKLTDPASVRINFRCTPAEREKYRDTAKRRGVGLATWFKALADRDSDT